MAYSRFKIDQGVFDFIGALPQPTITCLVKAFRKIKDGNVELIASSINPNLLSTNYCSYTILLSVTKDADTIVVIDVVQEINTVTDLW